MLGHLDVQLDRTVLDSQGCSQATVKKNVRRRTWAVRHQVHTFVGEPVTNQCEGMRVDLNSAQLSFPIFVLRNRF